jgi:hypothetical protein
MSSEEGIGEAYRLISRNMGWKEGFGVFVRLCIKEWTETQRKLWQADKQGYLDFLEKKIARIESKARQKRCRVEEEEEEEEAESESEEL